MEKRILRSCGLLALTVLCVDTSPSAVIAQQPQQTREGIVTTFAPVVEKVAPSVVTVFTTQTVSRGQTAFSFSDDALRQFSAEALRKDKANRRCKVSARV